MKISHDILINMTTEEFESSYRHDQDGESSIIELIRQGGVDLNEARGEYEQTYLMCLIKES